MTQLVDAAAFFDKLRHSDLVGPTISPAELNGLNRLLAAAGAAGWGVSWTAYLLATVWHETAGALAPVRERGGPDYFRRRYGIEGLHPNIAKALGNLTPGDGARYYGRGDVQTTGLRNYTKLSAALGVDLVDNPDLALDPVISARIAVHAMQTGLFTGKSLATYLPPVLAATREQFTQARRIINGIDCAGMIAGYAMTFQDALTLGGWS